MISSLYHRLAVLLLLVVLDVQGMSAGSLAQTSAASCSLDIQGRYNQSGIASVDINCTPPAGNPITLAFNSTLLNNTNFHFTGIVPVPAGVHPGGCGDDDDDDDGDPSGCLLSICSSQVTLVQARIRGLFVGEDDANELINGALCITRGSNVTVDGAAASDNTAALLFVGQGSSLAVVDSSFIMPRTVRGNNSQLVRSAQPFITAVSPRLLRLASTTFQQSDVPAAAGCPSLRLPRLLGSADHLVSVVAASAPSDTASIVAVNVDNCSFVNFTCRQLKVDAQNASVVVSNSMFSGPTVAGASGTFENGVALDAGSVAIYNSSISNTGPSGVSRPLYLSGGHVVVDGCRFASNGGEDACIFVDNLDSNGSIMISNSLFMQNTMPALAVASRSGVVFVRNVSVLDNLFPSNVRGGCLHHRYGSSDSSLVLQGFNCSNNRAASPASTNMWKTTYFLQQMQWVGGGGLYSTAGTLAITDSAFVNNSLLPASYGGGLTIMSGGRAVIANTSFAGNVAGTGAGIYADSLGGAALINVSGCVFADNVAVSGGGADIFASSSTQLLITNSSIDVGSPGVVWWRTQCVLGEVLQAGRCVRCGRFMYSLEPSNSSCDLCPPAGANCTGGDAIVPLAGWWHSDRHSIQLHKCPHLASSQQQQPVCQYGASCAAGYAGNLCGVCLSGFGSLGPFKCGRCLSRAAQWVWYGCGALFLLAVLAYTVAATWRDNQSSSTVLRPSDLLKVLILFVQYLVIVGSLSVPWPPSVTGLFAAANWVFAVSAGQALSLDCLLVASSSKLPLAIQRALVLLGAPLAMLAAVLLLDVAWRVCCWVLRCASTAAAKSRRVVLSLPQPQRCGCPLAESLQRLPVMAVVVLFVFYPSLVRTALSFFACYAIDDTTAAGQQMYAQYSLANAAGGYWVSDLSQACWSGWHFWWALCLGVSASAVLCVGVPAVLLAGLWCNRARLQAPGFRQRFGWLYRNFRPGRFWWEVLLALQTCVLVALSVFRFTLGVYYSTLLLNAAFLVGVLLQLLFRPFASAKLHRLQLLASTCLLLTTCIALSLFSLDVASHAGYRQVIGGIAVGVNAGFVCWCCWYILVESQGRLAGLARALAVAVQHAARRCLPAAAAAAAAHEALPSATHQVSLLKAPREFVPPA